MQNNTKCANERLNKNIIFGSNPRAIRNHKNHNIQYFDNTSFPWTNTMIGGLEPQY